MGRMDDGGLSQTEGMVEETRGEEDGEARSVATKRCGQGENPGGKWTGRRRARPGRRCGHTGDLGGWTTAEKSKIGNRGVSVLTWTDDRACDLAPLPYMWGRLISVAFMDT